MLRLLVAATAVAGVSGMRLKTEETQDFGFMGQGEDLPVVCGQKSITGDQSAWIDSMFTALGHKGVKKQAPVIFKNQVGGFLVFPFPHFEKCFGDCVVWELEV